jgi:predicted O-methyltransferase YrrM
MAVSSAIAVSEVVGETGGGTSPARGGEIHDFVRRERPQQCLELGFAHGVSTLYIASALEANGSGSLTSVDLPSVRDREPSAWELLDRSGLAPRVELVVEDAGYNWFLHRKLRERLNEDTIAPLYDFVFLDGAHSWDQDGLALALVTRLLRPGGWLLLDDLDWRFDERWPEIPAAQRAYAHVREIWELLVVPDPAFDELRTDGQWGWARRSSEPVPAVRTIVKRDLIGDARRAGRMLRGALQRRRRR